MKKLLIFTAIFALLALVNCNAQPKSEYEIYSASVTEATTYHFFLEKKSAVPYKLIQGMDYLSPNVVTLKIGQASTPVFVIILDNDGSEYTVGVVAENDAGFYGGMGVATGTVGVVPQTPAGVGLREK